LADVRAARTGPRSGNAGAAEGLARGITFANEGLLSSIRSGAALVSGLQDAFVVHLLNLDPGSGSHARSHGSSAIRTPAFALHHMPTAACCGRA